MKRRVGRGALILIALMFASSGALRLGDGLGASLARAAEGAAEGEMADHAEAGHDEMMAPHDADAACTAPSALAAALSEREARVLAQEAALSERGAALALAEEALRGQLEKIEAAEAELKKTLSLADGAAEEDIARLVAVYETMKPKDAAALFEAMEVDFAAGFLGRMRPDAAAAVLAGMSPEKAYAVSAVMAGRNALVPKN